jgi:hypothetical protein
VSAEWATVGLLVALAVQLDLLRRQVRAVRLESARLSASLRGVIRLMLDESEGDEAPPQERRDRLRRSLALLVVAVLVLAPLGCYRADTRGSGTRQLERTERHVPQADGSTLVEITETEQTTAHQTKHVRPDPGAAASGLAGMIASAGGGGAGGLIIGALLRNLLGRRRDPDTERIRREVP